MFHGKTLKLSSLTLKTNDQYGVNTKIGHWSTDLTILLPFIMVTYCHGEKPLKDNAW